MSTQRERTAFHEAGHAVASWWLRRGFKHVSIMPREDDLGHLLSTGFPKWFDPHSGCRDGRDQLLIEKEVQVLLAGYAAERKFDPKQRRAGLSDADFHSANDFTFYLHGDGKEAEVFIELQMILARSLVLRWWPCVQAVAAALLEHSTLSARKVHAICRDAPPEVP